MHMRIGSIATAHARCTFALACHKYSLRDCVVDVFFCNCACSMHMRIGSIVAGKPVHSGCRFVIYGGPGMVMRLGVGCLKDAISIETSCGWSMLGMVVAR